MAATMEKASCDIFQAHREKGNRKERCPTMGARLRTLKGRLKPTERGGWKTMPFILGNEICDTLAAYGLNFNMILYLTQKYNMQPVMAANVLNISSGTSSITPLIGGYLADSFLGRFWTLIISSCLNFVAMLFFVLSAVIPSLRPPPSHSSTLNQLLFLYSAFALLSISSGGIKPCAYPFGGDQFEQDTVEGRKSFQSFTNWYFFGVFITVLLGGGVFLYVQQKVSWAVAFGIPTVAMAISIVVFVLGLPLYKFETPAGSPLKEFAQVCIAAFQKRKLTLPADSTDLLDLRPGDGVKLIHTDPFRFLDKAAIIREGDIALDGKVLNPWRICTVHQVEQLKLILRTSPIMLATMFNAIAVSQQFNFCVLQATTMDKHMFGSFEIPPASIVLIGILTITICLPIYDKVVLPLARKMTGQERGITFLQRIGIGFAVAALAQIFAGIVERKRRDMSIQEGLMNNPTGVVSMSIFWLLPQITLFGMGEALYAVGSTEFFYDQVPEGMKSTVSSLNLGTGGLGTYISAMVLTAVQKMSARGGRVSWLDANLNRGRLDYYYYLGAGMIVANLVYFVTVANWYSYKSILVGGEGDHNHDHVEADSRQKRVEDKNGDLSLELHSVLAGRQDHIDHVAAAAAEVNNDHAAVREHRSMVELQNQDLRVQIHSVLDVEAPTQSNNIRKNHNQLQHQR